MPGDLTSDFLSKVTQSFIQNNTGCTGQILELLNFLPLCLDFLYFLRPLLDGPQSFIHLIPMLSIIIDPSTTEFVTPSSSIILDDVQKSKEEPKSKKKDNQSRRSQYNAISGGIKSPQLHK